MDISSKGKVRVNWVDEQENFSIENKNNIQQYFVDKYNLHKNRVQVIFNARNKDDKQTITLNNDTSVKDVMNNEYQRELFKQWLVKEEIKNIDHEKLNQIDDLVNMNLTNDQEYKNNNQTWRLLSLELDNFLSFGESNKLDIKSRPGIIGINSEPKNQGGKTSLILEAIRFVIYGKTNKCDKNEDIFNLFTDKDNTSVSITIDLNGDIYCIERVLNRKERRSGGYTVKSTVEYYKIELDGTKTSLNDEDSKKSTKLITEAFGLESDFDLTIIADNKTLTDLIMTKPTERAKLLNRFIGLEILEKKHTIAKKIYSDFSKKLLSNQYEIPKLKEDNITFNEEIVLLETNIKECDSKIKDLDSNIELLEVKKDNETKRLKEVDERLVNVNEEKLNNELKEIEERGKKLKEELNQYKEVFKDLSNVEYDEVYYDKLVKTKYKLVSDITNTENKITLNRNRLKEIEDSKICKICDKSINDIIYKDEKEQKTKELKTLLKEKENYIAEQTKTEVEIKKYAVQKEKNDKKNKTELTIAKLNLDVSNLREEYREKNEKLTSFKKNKENITLNKEINYTIEKLKSDIFTKNNQRRIVSDEKQKSISSINNKKELIDKNLDLIKKIELEKIEDFHYSTYVKMMGTKGVSKMVFKSTIPIINSELSNLLNDVCDFELELKLNDKNDVEFVIIKDGVENNIKGGSGLEQTIASLALRNVLSMVSTLSKPTFIIFDETWGAIAENNLDSVKFLMDKIKKNYDNIFIITHNNIINDWSDYIVTINKENNISRITSN